MANSTRPGRGFASMDPQRQRQISARGGRAAHQSGNAHEFTPEEARAAGALRHRQPQQQSAATPQADGRRADADGESEK
ncbi:hypothetical protein GCM10023144_04590 [Pigmentiphaga soli]|uniref:Stress-induced protein n=1 Tax=Pigmentiphaga soli TaxID=1007095 RepID=A0ABP8GGL2_9BURK